MSALLGNYLSSGDLIVVHMCGNGKDLNLQKRQEYLGLTITDNGHGRAFVKKVKSNDGLIEELIKPGDHIAAINAESTIGFRHYEVAKAIRELPERATFTLHLIEPCHSDKQFEDEIVEPNTNPETINKIKASIPLVNFSETNYKSNDTNQNNIQVSDDSLSNLNRKHQLQLQTNQAPTIVNNFDSLSSNEDLVNSSLPIERLLSKGAFTCHEANTANNGLESANQNTQQDTYRITIEKINSILESFLGINDNLLAIQIYRLARENKDSLSSFSSAIQTSELNVFNFDRDIENYLWECATDDCNG